MQFALSLRLYALWVVILVVIFIFWAQKRQTKLLQRFARPTLIEELTKNFDRKRKIYKDIFLVLVFILNILALARPQWGFEWEEVKRSGLDILLAIDTSRSMLTEDVKPNRLNRTKLAVKDLLKKLQGDRIGLVAFAGKAFLVCPLTVDYLGFLLSLEDLDSKTIPQGGTNIAEAIEEALKEYDQTPSKYKAVIIVTDGENLEGEPVVLAKKAKDKGIKIYCVGIGTKEGELIRVQNDLGEYEFLKDSDGNFVKSRLNEKLLQEIALLTGGTYIRASGANFGLDLIYDQELSKFERREMESKRYKRFHERFQIPLAWALIFLVLETVTPLGKKSQFR